MKKIIIFLIFLSLVSTSQSIPKIPSHIILRLYQLMKDTHEILTHHDIPYWIHAGTLLGAVRHEGLIPWDDDLDIVIENIYEEKLSTFLPIFESIGYTVQKVHYGYKIYCIHDNGPSVHLDIMIFIHHEDKYIYDPEKIGPHSPWKAIFFNEKDLLPFKEYQFGEITVMGPQNPIPFLDLVYLNWQNEAHICNHHFFCKPPVPLTDQHIVAGQPTGPLTDNVLFRNVELLKSVVIREALTNDADALVNLLIQLGFPQYSYSDCLLKITKFKQTNTDKVWVAQIEQSIVGFLAVNIITPFYKTQPFARVDSIVVDKLYRNCGIGTMLMRHAEKFAKKHHCSRIFLTSGNHRIAAHAFYKSIGYVNNATYFVKNLYS